MSVQTFCFTIPLGAHIPPKLYFNIQMYCKHILLYDQEKFLMFVFMLRNRKMARLFYVICMTPRKKRNKKEITKKSQESTISERHNRQGACQNFGARVSAKGPRCGAQRARQVHARKGLQRTVSAHSDSMHPFYKDARVWRRTEPSPNEPSIRPCC